MRLDYYFVKKIGQFGGDMHFHERLLVISCFCLAIFIAVKRLSLFSYTGPDRRRLLHS